MAIREIAGYEAYLKWNLACHTKHLWNSGANLFPNTRASLLIFRSECKNVGKRSSYSDASFLCVKKNKSKQKNIVTHTPFITKYFVGIKNKDSRQGVGRQTAKCLSK